MQPIEQAASGDAPPRGSESILLLEDDDMVRDLARDVLEGLGYAVTAVDRPSKAIAAAAAARFDLVVTDVVMPEMMGDAVATRLRTADPDLRVEFMSGYTARALDFELGPHDSMLHKPVRPRDLAATVRAALDS